MTIWANVMIAGAIAIFVGLLIRGAYKFEPQRARNVKHAEREHDPRANALAEAQQAHPEIVRVSRLDRHIWFLVPHMMVFAYSICLFSGAELTSNVKVLGDQARYTMAICFLIGSIIVLTGATLGLRLGVKDWVIKRDVSEHLTDRALGDDIVLPYRVEMAGLSAMFVSSSIYSWTSFQSTTGSLGGWLTLGIAVCCGLSVISFYRAVKVFQQWDHTLISEAEARLAGGAADADAH